MADVGVAPLVPRLGKRAGGAVEVAVRGVWCADGHRGGAGPGCGLAGVAARPAIGAGGGDDTGAAGAVVGGLVMGAAHSLPAGAR